MNFTLKHYKKGASIQLKPKDDISSDPQRCVHFSVAWFKTGDCDASKEEQRAITTQLYKELIVHLASVDWKLNFTITKACENCTYGHFDEAFEKIIIAAREKYPLCVEKNLPLHLHPDVPQNRPIMFHIAHSRSTDEALNKLLKKPGETLALKIDACEVNK